MREGQLIGRSSANIRLNVCVNLGIQKLPAFLTVVNMSRKHGCRYSSRATATAHLFALAQLFLLRNPSAKSARPYVIGVLHRTVSSPTQHFYANIYSAEISRKFIESEGEFDGFVVDEKIFNTADDVEERLVFFNTMVELVPKLIIHAVKAVCREENAMAIDPQLQAKTANITSPMMHNTNKTESRPKRKLIHTDNHRRKRKRHGPPYHDEVKARNAIHA